MDLKWKFLLAAAGVLVLLLIGLTLVIFKRLVPTEPLPTVQGQLKLAHLTSPVIVMRDRQGVPHIYANTPSDAICALGYVHAQDRRLQMEFLRRTARGEAALLSGEASLPSDRLMLTLGLAKAAETEAAQLTSEDRLLFEAYARGVNAATEQTRWFKGDLARLLNVPGDEWTVSDTLSVLKLISVSYSTQYYEELLTASLQGEVGSERLGQFIPNVPDDRQLPIIDSPPAKSDAPSRPTPAAARRENRGSCPKQLACADLMQSLAAVMAPAQIGLGSNSWVIHGDITSGGSPYLASDPHMALSAPSGIYAAHLSAPGLEVSGVGIPGTPVFLHGHNSRIAWAVTVAGVDTQDLYLEELSEQDPTLVRTATGWEKLQTREEQIRVRGRDKPVTFTVRSSAHGPLISDANPVLLEPAWPAGQNAKQKYALALSITGLGPASPSWVFGLVRARDWTSFRDALRNYSGSGFNFVYADVDGNIGYQLAARVPLREGGPPETPVPGWEPNREWRGLLPFDSLPSILNPPDKVIVTANARISGPGYPFYLGTRWGDLPWRVRRIHQLIRSKPKVAISDLAEIQLDVYQESMLQLIEWARLAPSDNADAKRFQQALDGWDMKAATGSVQQTLAEAFRLELLQEVFRPHLSEKLLSTYTSYPLFSSPALERAMTDPKAALFGPSPDSARARRTEAVGRAITAAFKQLKGKFGVNQNRWAWGKVHLLTFRSPLAQSPNLLTAWMMSDRNVGPFAASGSNTTVNVAFWTSPEPFAVVNGAGFRQLIDLGDFSNSVYLPPPPGQSENPKSPHYRDLGPAWAQGTYYPMRWIRKQIEDEAEATLTLLP